MLLDALRLRRFTWTSIRVERTRGMPARLLLAPGLSRRR
jgi:hypothetical protein